MIIKSAEYVTTILNDPAVDTIMGGEDMVYLGYAEQDTPRPFMTYLVTGGIKLTKNGLRDYTVTISVYDESITKAGEKADAINDYIEGNHTWRLQGFNPGYTSEEGKTAVIEITYNFKL